MNTPSNRTEMTITIERTPRTFTVDGNDIQVEELGIRLPFARKPVDLKDMCATGDYLVYITETRTMTPDEFDGFGKAEIRGGDKADIVARAFTGYVTPRVPASLLQLHPNAVLVGDEAALSRLPG